MPLKMVNAALLTLLLAALLSGAAVSARAQESDPLRFERPPKDTVVLIFNHGTLRPQRPHACNRARDIPAVIEDVAAANHWMVFYLCSHATDEDEPGSYTFKRANEIMDAIRAIRSRGVPARQIFLVGQSAGAWASLLVQRVAAETMNGVIALAPAFAGPRREEALYPWWRREIFPRQMAFVAQAKALNALIFAFPDDDYDRPQELAPLVSVPGVILISFNQCAAGHLTAYTPCFRSAARQLIEAFIRSRIR